MYPCRFSAMFAASSSSFGRSSLEVLKNCSPETSSSTGAGFSMPVPFSASDRASTAGFVGSKRADVEAAEHDHRQDHLAVLVRLVVATQ